jgi:hypothetical protein
MNLLKFVIKIFIIQVQNFQHLHKYNPTKIIENVSNYKINEHFIIDEKFRAEYLENMIKIIDMTPRDKCCNCISFTLYSTAIIEAEEATGDANISYGSILFYFYRRRKI